MRERLDQLLDQRRESLRPTKLRRLAIAASVTLHAGVAGAVILAPELRRQAPTPIEYVAVQVVTPAALGIERPAPQPEPRRQPEPPRPEPMVPEPVLQPVMPEPEPRRVEPEPEPEPTPRPEPRPEPREERWPEPTREQQEGSPTGRPEGTASAAVAGLDQPDFTYGYYIDQMLAQIRAHWARPPVGAGVETIVHFRIERDGTVTDLRVATPSGVRSFDMAGLRAVQSASPLPPLPRGYRRDSLGVNLILR